VGRRGTEAVVADGQGEPVTVLGEYDPAVGGRAVPYDIGDRLAQRPGQGAFLVGREPVVAAPLRGVDVGLDTGGAQRGRGAR
jgi:hypothetical protein